jgi:hypothetical protein
MIQVQTLNYSSPFEANLKFFTRRHSDFQMPNLKTLPFPGDEIPSYPYKVHDLDGVIG